VAIPGLGIRLQAADGTSEMGSRTLRAHSITGSHTSKRGYFNPQKAASET